MQIPTGNSEDWFLLFQLVWRLSEFAFLVRQLRLAHFLFLGGKNMDIEKIQYLGYEIVLIYQPFYDDSTPKSRQYRVIVKKENIEFINRYGLTRGSALAYSKNWINRKENINC